MLALLTNLALGVGITGHRRLDETQLPRIKSQLNDVFIQIRNAAVKISSHGQREGFFKDKPVLRLVSCLSEGSDRIAAETALANDYGLQGILPFPLGSPAHALDLEGEAKAESLSQLRRLCKKAESLLQLQPDIPLWLEGKDLWTNDSNADAFRQLAYLKASQEMLNYSDILIAIWNGKPQPAPGGTFDTILSALNKNIIVCIIDSLQNVPIKIARKKEDLFSSTLPKPGLEQAVIQNFILSDDASISAKNTENQITEEMRRKKLPVLAQIWKKFEKLVTGWKIRRLGLAEYSGDFPASRESDIFNAFDSYANYCASMHRSSFLWLALLTLFSIMFGAMAAVWPDEWHRNLAIPVLSLAEIGMLICAIFNVYQAMAKNWQKRLTSFRMIAEIIRLNNFADKIGLSSPYYLLGRSLYSENATIDWHIYFLRNIIRLAGFSSYNMADKIQTEHLRQIMERLLIYNQWVYHKKNHVKCQFMFNVMENATAIVFFLSLLVLILQFMDALFFPFLIFTSFLTFIGTVGPAIGAASQTINQTAELKRLSIRSAHMASAMEKYETRLKECISPMEFQKIIGEVIYTMMEDIKDWHDQYSMPDLNLS